MVCRLLHAALSAKKPTSPNKNFSQDQEVKPNLKEKRVGTDAYLALNWFSGLTVLVKVEVKAQSEKKGKLL